MGDRYELIKDCVYCGETEEDCWYAPTCNSFGFTCKKCKRYNFIATDFEVKKIEDVTYEEIYDTLAFTSNMMDEKMIKSCAKEFYDNLKKDELTEIMKEKLRMIKDGNKRKSN